MPYLFRKESTTPAEAGAYLPAARTAEAWVPAFAGMNMLMRGDPHV
jgi:hypothetical protein